MDVKKTTPFIKLGYAAKFQNIRMPIIYKFGYQFNFFEKNLGTAFLPSYKFESFINVLTNTPRPPK